MTKRIPAASWTYLKKNYPDDVVNMACIKIPVNRFNVFMKKRFGTKNKKISKNNVQRYGRQLGCILDWIDENCNDMYYAEPGDIDFTSSNLIIEFYFMDETDAMALKLMFD